MTSVILGCGFTGVRVARLLSARGERVIATVHRAGEERLVLEAGAVPLVLDADDAASREAFAGRCLDEGEGLRILIAFPPARLPAGGERTASVLASLAGRFARVVQISSTAVYGEALRVDAATEAHPTSALGRLHLDAEGAVRDGPWSWLVLRAAAIYGPGRGLLAEGGPRFSHARSLDAVVSRIHVDDLAALAAAALGSDLRGAFPAADEEPASGRQLLAAWSGVSWAPPPGRADAPGSRRVDGSAVARALGVRLRYPSFRDALR